MIILKHSSYLIKLTILFIIISLIILLSPRLHNEFTETTITAKPSFTIRFFGDVMLGRHVETLLRQYGEGYVLDKWPDDNFSDYNVINFESAMTYPHRQTANYTFRFATNPRHLSVLEKLQVTHASLANNHALDFGDLGYQLVRESFAKRSIEPFGHPTIISTSTSLAFIEQSEVRVALIGIHTLYNNPSDEELISVFSYVNDNSDYQVVYIHWGEEYALESNNAQRKLAQKLVNLGADVVIGHHPHVTQEIEMIDGVPVFYSLGNFIFDQYFSPAVMDGLVVDMILDETLTFKLLPITSRDSQSQPRLMTDLGKTHFLEALADRSDVNLKKMILVGKIELEKLAIAP